MTTPIDQLHALGQSIWYDNIERRLLNNGELAAVVGRGDIRGLTSNPSIFHNAIAKSSDYDTALLPLAKAGCNPEEIYEQLAMADIRAAADLLRPLFEQTRGGDGYVSLEVSPALAQDTARTLSEALRLFATVDRPNLMIKIPATKEGLPAIRQAIAAGLNVNVTLIFSLTRDGEVMDAYISGLEDRVVAGQSIAASASVASFFISRIDTKIDSRLDALAQNDPTQRERAQALKGKLAIASGRLAYQEFRKVFTSARFAVLEKQNARLQRPLWASTGTKNPAYSDTVYVDTLIGPNTVNTLPPQTLAAFKDHGVASVTIENDLEGARQAFAGVAALGISMDQVTQELEDEGVKTFMQAYEALLKSIAIKAQAAEVAH